MICFVSGHLDLTDDEFQKHYVPKLSFALEQGSAFVVGDAVGADTRSMSFLAERTSNITIFHMLYEPRNMVAGACRVGGFESDEERDAALTMASHVDIAWVRPGRESSGTARNLERRKSLSERGLQ